MDENIMQLIARCMPKDTIERYIWDYTSYGIEPDYSLEYQKTPYEKSKYSLQEATAAIEQHRQELQEKLHRLDEFQYLIMKKSFPDKFPDYVRELAKKKHPFLYEKMNEECQYLRGDSRCPLWTCDNIFMNYCRDHDVDGLSTCKSCRFFLDIIHSCATSGNGNSG